MNNLYINLNIISKIRPNEKIYINSDGFISIEQNNMFQGIVRFIFNNSRSKSINNLCNFYNTLYMHIDQLLTSIHLKSENKLVLIEQDMSEKQIVAIDSLQEVAKYIQMSLIGMENLKKTYMGDVYIISVLDLIISNANSYLKKINKKILETNYNCI